LQQILFYRELDMKLDDIKRILHDPKFNLLEALNLHRENLIQKRSRLDKLIANVEKTILYKRGEIDMTDNEKFEGFKQNLIDENEKKYGSEIREKYGEEAVERSNQKFKNMTPQEYEEVTKLNERLMNKLLEAFKTGDPEGELAQQAADLHRQWLTFYWDNYSREAHAGVAQMYVDDPRFTEYYDKHQPGLAVFLRDAVLKYTEQ
jgi:DNA-binding transcriptional MerR regulator